MGWKLIGKVIKFSGTWTEIFDHFFVRVHNFLVALCINHNNVFRLQPQHQMNRWRKIGPLRHNPEMFNLTIVDWPILINIRYFEIYIHNLNCWLFFCQCFSPSFHPFHLSIIFLDCFSIIKTRILVPNSIFIKIMMFLLGFLDKMRKPNLTEVFSMQRLSN